MSRWIYPDIGRPGLANSLLPLARALVLSRAANVPMLAPRWARLRIGPFLRGERDKRSYWRYMRGDPADVTGMRRLLALAQPNRVTEAKAWEEMTAHGGLRSNGVVVVRGMDDYFVPLRGHAELIRASFIQRVADDALTPPTARPAPGSYIAIHARRGDFTIDPKALTPLEWFVDRLTALRSAALSSRASPQHAFVVTDGSREELQPLLELPGVSLWQGKSAADDLVLLAGARAVLGSANSTFSMLGAFLGNGTLIMPPGGNLPAGVFGDAARETESALGAALPQIIVASLYAA
jgi:hypothetical protein